jgi:hypothetical protein
MLGLYSGFGCQEQGSRPFAGRIRGHCPRSADFPVRNKPRLHSRPGLAQVGWLKPAANRVPQVN